MPIFCKSEQIRFFTPEPKYGVIFEEGPISPKDIFYRVERFPNDRPIEEGLTVFDQGGHYSIRRTMAEDATSIDTAVIQVEVWKDSPCDTACVCDDNKIKRAVAFAGETPCAPSEYFTDLCVENSLLSDYGVSCYPYFEDGSYPCNSAGELFYGEEGQYISDKFSRVADISAKYYSKVLEWGIGRDEFVSAGKSYKIDENGIVSKSKSLNYNRGDLTKAAKKWREWNISRKYAKEPSNPVAVESIRITDTGDDGVTDRIYTNWLNAHGDFLVDFRSSYTASTLGYFDGIWKKLPEVDSYWYEARSIQSLEVFVEKGDNVDSGDALFSYMTERGVKTFYAEADGEVEYFSNNYGRLIITIKAD